MTSQLQRFAAALYPDTIRCLGRRLRPLTVGHILLLARLEHPLVIGKGLYDAASLALGVAVCSLPYPRAAKAVSGPLFRARLLWLGLKARFAPRARFVFTQYLIRGATAPKWSVKETGNGGVASGNPFWCAVLGTLQSDLGRSHDEALATPAAVALWLCGGIWEGRGALEMASEAELAILEGGQG